MAGGYNDIDAGNGEIIQVSNDDSADGVRMVQDGEQVILVDEDALDVFAVKTTSTLTDLDEARTILTGGSLGPVAGLAMVPDNVYAQIDAQQLKTGAFPEALALTEAYLEHFYKPGADQVERIHHGINAAKTVAGESMAAYLDSDGNVAADVTAIDSEFTAGGALTATEFAALQDQSASTETNGDANPQGSDQTESIGEDEPPTLL